MKHLDLCSGIGGFALAARWAGFETIQFCEIDKWCQKILKKHWPDVPCHDDLKTFNGKPFYGTVDILTAGYPCQPFSHAGKKKGEEDERHLWPEVLRVINESRPEWIICENVEGHIRLGYDTVHSDLESAGFTVWPFIIPASGIGAKHQRKRLWIIAYAPSKRLEGELCNKREFAEIYKQTSNEGGTQADRTPGFYNVKNWLQKISSNSHRGINGVPNRVDRLRGLGNAVVPQIPYLIMEAIKENLSTQRRADEPE